MKNAYPILKPNRKHMQINMENVALMIMNNSAQQIYKHFNKSLKWYGYCIFS